MKLSGLSGYLPFGLAFASRLDDVSSYFGVWLGADAPSSMLSLPRKSFEECHALDMELDSGLYRPILRPMSDLLGTVQDLAFNDGYSFQPLRELLRPWFWDSVASYKVDDSGLYYFISVGTPELNFGWDQAEHCFSAWWSENDLVEAGDSVDIRNVHVLYDLLHRWHFDYRGLIDEGLAFSVHDVKVPVYFDQSLKVCSKS